MCWPSVCFVSLRLALRRWAARVRSLARRRSLMRKTMPSCDRLEDIVEPPFPCKTCFFRSIYNRHSLYLSDYAYLSSFCCLLNAKVNHYTASPSYSSYTAFLPSLFLFHFLSFSLSFNIRRRCAGRTLPRARNCTEEKNTWISICGISILFAKICIPHLYFENEFSTNFCVFWK